jgi:UDP-N-acetylmuramoyl-L-alanyl-D-glutamate--2,6-diaminopimelate ligase
MNFKQSIRKFIPKFALNIYHFKLALLGAFLYGFPGKNKSIKIIGITGTSGKSTTVDFVCRILEEAGNRVSSISSVKFKLAEKEWENKHKMTMPGRFVIQKFLRQAINAKCKYVVLEVTSEGIRQSRHRFINFDTAVFTNLSKEHIESHGSFENYRNEKLKLFKIAKNIHVINLDDENAKYFAEIPAIFNFQFSIFNKFSIFNFQTITAEDVVVDKNGVSFQIQNAKFQIPLIGQFNVYNALASISVAKAYNINLEVCKRALEKVKGISGRMEIVAKNPLVVVDYAHTPDQLEVVYKSFEGKNLICVLGSCGGGRDKWKRPVLGEVAKKYCKEIIITNEDPYDENPMDIINQVAENAGSSAKKILDRKEAIKKAILSAKPEDVVIITGKGSEPWMCIADGKKVPWSDKNIVLEEQTKKYLPR